MNKLFLIRYITDRGTEAVDVQNAPHILEAMVQHYLAFPSARYRVVRTMGS